MASGCLNIEQHDAITGIVFLDAMSGVKKAIDLHSCNHLPNFGKKKALHTSTVFSRKGNEKVNRIEYLMPRLLKLDNRLLMRSSQAI